MVVTHGTVWLMVMHGVLIAVVGGLRTLSQPQCTAATVTIVIVSFLIGILYLYLVPTTHVGCSMIRGAEYIVLGCMGITSIAHASTEELAYIFNVLSWIEILMNVVSMWYGPNRA
eukprot:PhF_6_TR39981/c1_g1_i1/m.59343